MEFDFSPSNSTVPIVGGIQFCKSIWKLDDFTKCARLIYLETYIPLILSLLSIITIIVSIIYTSTSGSARAKDEDLKYFGSMKLNVEETEPLLNGSGLNYSSLENEISQTYTKLNNNTNELTHKVGEIVAKSHFSLDNITPLKDDGTPLSLCKLVYKDFWEKLSNLFEFLLVLFEVILHIIPFYSNDLFINFKTSQFGSSPIITGFAFWSYLLILSAFRISHLSTGLSFKYPNLWYHSTTLYFISWLPCAITFRSALLNHVKTNEGKWFYILHFIFNTLLVLNNGGNKFSDRPVILHYDTPDSIPSSEPCTSLFNIISYAYLDNMVFRAYKKPILEEEIYGLVSSDLAYNVLTKFHLDKSKLKFTWKLFSQFKWYFLTQFALTSIEAVLTFVPAMLLKRVLEYIKDPDSVPSSLAWLYVSFILLAAIVECSCSGRCLFIGRKVCTRMRAILIGEIYAKALRRKITTNMIEDDSKKEDESNDESKKSSDASTKSNNKKEGENESSSASSDLKDLGTIINLMSVDAFKVSEICGYLHYFVNAFIMAGMSVYLLYQLLGWPALVGAATTAVVLPINYKLASKFGEYSKDMLKVTDKRIQKLNEVFQNIRIIKFFAWEDQFAKSIYDVREEEISYLKGRAYVWIFSLFVWYFTPYVIALAAFYAHTELAGKALTTPIAFTALSLFNLLRAPLDVLADMMALVVQSKVSLDRVEEFLAEPESSKYEQLSHQRSSDSPLVGFQNASLSWSTDVNDTNSFKLRDIDIQFEVGKLNVIMGPTGSGKSSLLLALLGEMNLNSGSIYLPGIIPRDELVPNPVTGLTESVAYCAQTAWLLNGTIRDNILFASPFNKERYEAVLFACALTRDLEILDDGDETEVGEKGITLSGGQKQRVSLARALYSSSAYVLLDDCLSAVDSHTSAHIFEHCILGPLMKGRTCILVTHNVALAGKHADYIVSMDNGRISSQGSQKSAHLIELEENEGLRNVVESTNVSYSDLSALNALNKKPKKSIVSIDDSSRAGLELEANATHLGNDVGLDIATDSPVVGDEPLKKKKKNKLIEDETKSEGSVSKEVYAAYFGYYGGYWVWISFSIFFILCQLLTVFLSYWVKIWAHTEDQKVIHQIATSVYSITSSISVTSAYSSIVNFASKIDMNKPIYTQLFTQSFLDNHSNMFYFWIYCGSSLLYAFFGAIRIGIALLGSLHVSRVMFQKLLGRMLRAKLRFFDSTPVGRIINRFSKDMEGVDQELAPQVEGVAVTILQSVTILITVMVVTPPFLIFGILIGVIFYWCGVFYITLSRDLKRFESITKSPIHQQFSETLTGVTTIRAYGDERRFVRQNLEKIDKNNKPFYYVWIANRWLAYRVDVLGALISFLSYAFAVGYARHLDAGLAGISLSFAAAFSMGAVWIVRMYAQVEINMNSVERLEEYMKVDQEPEAHLDPSVEPPASWPSAGVIEVNDLSLRYAPGLPKVIDGVTFDAKACSKIGIVGRTGAGKSTIITAFFRFLDPETGYIKIDGYDITKIGLHRLRSGITIIPQDPTLFTGTIRSNLDPFSEYSDIQIFEALKRVSLISSEEYEYVIKNGTPPPPPSSSNTAAAISTPSSSNGEPTADAATTTVNEENINKFLKLDNAVSEGGSNLSQGQRQLTCLARSLLKSPKIIMLDEATASIDYQSDAKIQHTIREEFAGSTILTIAHRLKTIIDYDMILVLDAGKVKEFDSPYELITREGSQFRSMCEDTGEFDDLVALAKEAYNSKK